jgi:hypothetical protein
VVFSQKLYKSSIAFTDRKTAPYFYDAAFPAIDSLLSRKIS